jgi:hypothetical protein
MSDSTRNDMLLIKLKPRFGDTLDRSFEDNKLAYYRADFHFAPARLAELHDRLAM